MSDPLSILRSVFGYDEFRPGQADIVAHILAGTPTLCVMPTGAGKSLCYQVPALLLDGPAIIVSPLTALMDDQVAGLRANGVAAAAIHSGRDRADNVADWKRVRAGEVKLLYLSPERLMTPRMLGALDALAPALFVVDEAHCISKWGASFRPEYEQLAALKDRFPGARLAAFTATADAATREDIAARLFGGSGEIVVHGFDRPNLSLAVEPKSNGKKQLLDFLDVRRGAAGIVYCLSRKSTEEIAGLLVSEGYRALPYHAGLSPELRREHQETFMAEEGVVMVATIAFGMGIDKPDIRYVVHLNMPGSMEAYYQEIGRAGRDGRPAEAMMFYGLSDARMRRQFVDDDSGDEGHKRREHKRLDALLAYCEATRCRRLALLAYFGEPDGRACGNCDTCLDPPELVDATREAQMLMSAIARTGQRFGAAHIVDVVRGADTRRIRERGHDRLPTHGVGADRPKSFWQGLVRQCLAGGYLDLDIEGFGALKLTAAGDHVLKGRAQLEIREIKPIRTERRQRRIEAAEAEGDIDAGLLATLKTLRKKLAAERQVPAYVIFSDATLIEMCRIKPQTLDELGLVKGVGPKKLADYGHVFLDALG
ncbi:DNA helicase RecQ [Maricaulis sp.]|uniref:DNA helicase RecQ n=1 Tax=Maricaulis sp. TaxID=1486257 RepID=UPI0026185B59|nr:DNA helicase RecQ [Maricaulis sp.]